MRFIGYSDVFSTFLHALKASIKLMYQLLARRELSLTFFHFYAFSAAAVVFL